MRRSRFAATVLMAVLIAALLGLYVFGAMLTRRAEAEFPPVGSFVTRWKAYACTTGLGAGR